MKYSGLTILFERQTVTSAVDVGVTLALFRILDRIRGARPFGKTERVQHMQGQIAPEVGHGDNKTTHDFGIYSRSHHVISSLRFMGSYLPPYNSKLATIILYMPHHYEGTVFVKAVF